MNASGTAADPVIEWGVAGRGLEEASGDLHVVLPFAGGALVGLVDGLGHGPEAAVAAQAAAAVLACEPQAPVQELMTRCHDGMRKTRGAAMTLASLDASRHEVQWCGVGNVDAVLLRVTGRHWAVQSAALPRGGVVGYQLPPLRVDAQQVRQGDMLVMTTDGIRSGFVDGLEVDMLPAQVSQAVLQRFAKSTDDAHVLVVRYLGSLR